MFQEVIAGLPPALGSRKSALNLVEGVESFPVGF